MSNMATLQGLMSGIGIRFSVPDLNRWTKAIEKVRRRALVYVGGELQRLQAADLSIMFKVAILTDKHGFYKGYSKKYAKWKEAQTGVGVGFWKLKMDLLNNVQAFAADRTLQGGQNWAAGVPNDIRDSGYGKRYGSPKSSEIAWYGRIMEFRSTKGGQNHPARPLFIPRSKAYAKSPARRARAKAALVYIKTGWH